VHATRVLGADPATASLIYTMFFVAMTAVRFVGDAARTRLGVSTTIRLTCGAAVAGYGLVLLAPLLSTTPDGAAIGCAMVGWALAGAGIALVWPIVASALGAANGPGRRLAAATSISYGGGLAGPALIGYIAERATLPVALLIPATLVLALAVVAPIALAVATRQASTSDGLEPSERGAHVFTVECTESRRRVHRNHHHRPQQRLGLDDQGLDDHARIR
jgi:MFS family permease